jgi:hypothetical protein
MSGIPNYITDGLSENIKKIINDKNFEGAKPLCKITEEDKCKKHKRFSCCECHYGTLRIPCIHQYNGNYCDLTNKYCTVKNEDRWWACDNFELKGEIDG